MLQTNWMLNGKKAEYDWHHSAEYKKCPFCGKESTSGSYSPSGNWSKKFQCGSEISAIWSNDEYKLNHDAVICANNTYNEVEVIGKVLIPTNS